MLQMQQLKKTFRTELVETHALRGLNLAVKSGEFVAFTGSSGSGKTTFLNIAGLLETVGLASRMKHIPAQLSGGQQQRVAIARALSGEPKLLLADEPTGNLDTVMALQVMELLQEIHAAGTTIVMVTHDPELAGRAERNIHLMDGRVQEGIVQDGQIAEPRQALPQTHGHVGAKPLSAQA